MPKKTQSSTGSKFFKGAVAGGALGTIVPGVGTVIGAVIGGIAGATGLSKGSILDRGDQDENTDKYTAEEKKGLAIDQLKKQRVIEVANQIGVEFSPKDPKYEISDEICSKKISLKKILSYFSLDELEKTCRYFDIDTQGMELDDLINAVVKR